jgi:hypothetical protein
MWWSFTADVRLVDVHRLLPQVLAVPVIVMAST